MHSAHIFVCKDEKRLERELLRPYKIDVNYCVQCGRVGKRRLLALRHGHRPNVHIQHHQRRVSGKL